MEPVLEREPEAVVVLRLLRLLPRPAVVVHDVLPRYRVHLRDPARRVRRFAGISVLVRVRCRGPPSVSSSSRVSTSERPGKRASGGGGRASGTGVPTPPPRPPLPRAETGTPVGTRVACHHPYWSRRSSHDSYRRRTLLFSGSCLFHHYRRSKSRRLRSPYYTYVHPSSSDRIRAHSRGTERQGYRDRPVRDP